MQLPHEFALLIKLAVFMCGYLTLFDEKELAALGADLSAAAAAFAASHLREMRALVPPTHRAPLAKKLVRQTSAHAATHACAAVDRRLGAGRAALGACWRGARDAAWAARRACARTGLPKAGGVLALAPYTAAAALVSIAFATQWPAAAAAGWWGGEDGAPRASEGNASAWA